MSQGQEDSFRGTFKTILKVAFFYTNKTGRGLHFSHVISERSVTKVLGLIIA